MNNIELTEEDKKMLNRLITLGGCPIPFSAMDNALVKTLVNIIRYQAMKLKELEK